MAARIVWCVLTLCILAVFQVSVTKEQPRCRFRHGCMYCKSPKGYRCVANRFCMNWRTMVNLCTKYNQELEERYSANLPLDYIVGGSPTDEGNWPWQVSLQTQYFDLICGGVLIDHDWVLTAAHCVHKALKPNAKDFIVVLGEFDLKRRSGNEQYQWIKHIFVHSKYQPGGNTYDVALIQLEDYVYYNEYVSPIGLPSFYDVYLSNRCYITGWGLTKGTGDKSRLLRELKVTMLAPNVCKKLWKGEVKIRPKHNICVNNGLTGACMGDSGGPLSCPRRSDGRFVVAGVSSFGSTSCQELDKPSVYTNIRTFVPWINNIMRRST